MSDVKYNWTASIIMKMKERSLHLDFVLLTFRDL